jgi:hypothetical protein
VDPLAATAEHAASDETLASDAPSASASPIEPVASAPAASRAGFLRKEWLTLLLGLLIAYVFATSTLPALLQRSELRDRRAQTEAEIGRLNRDVRVLQDWNAGARTDPQLRERLLESQRLSPDADGYREVPDAGAAQAAQPGAKG